MRNENANNILYLIKVQLTKLGLYETLYFITTITITTAGKILKLKNWRNF